MSLGETLRRARPLGFQGTPAEALAQALVRAIEEAG